MSSPLSVAVSVVLNDDDEVLLIERQRGEYTGMWALPGGKVEHDEHVDQAAVREVLEEAGIDTSFDSHLGVVSEHLKEDGDIDSHFILHICLLEPEGRDIDHGEEGEVRWFDVSDLESLKDDMVVSDFHILKKAVEDDLEGCVRCVIDESGEKHELRKFEG